MYARLDSGAIGRDQARCVMLFGRDALFLRAVYEYYAAVQGLFRHF